MLPVHTQRTLDKLTWNEVQKIHSSLGLKATAETRTRRDYQRRIVATQPQPIAEPEAVATALTCATCPFAVLLEGNRYECGAKVTNSVTRGHWEAKDECYAEVAAQETATETESPLAQPEETPAAPAPIAYQEITATQSELHQVTAQPAPKTFNHPFRYRQDIYNGQHLFSSAIYGLCECDRCKVVQTNSQEIEQLSALIAHPEESTTAIPEATITADINNATTDDAPPNRNDNGRGRVTALTALPKATIVLPHATKPKADDNFMTAFTKESKGDRRFNDLAYLSQLKMEAQLAIERTVIGSEEEAIAYAHLRQIERDIEFYNRPESKPQPSPVIQQLKTQMKELKADTLKLFKIEPFDQSILPTCDDEREQPVIQSEPEPEGTIHWTMPLSRGVIVGKKGATRQFYIRNNEIFIVLSGEFTASETKHPNIRHRQIREAINLGRTFNPRIFKLSPNFEQDTQACNGGRIRQECDGRWWAWVDGGITGQPFPCETLALHYLDRVAANKQPQRRSAQMSESLNKSNSYIGWTLPTGKTILSFRVNYKHFPVCTVDLSDRAKQTAFKGTIVPGMWVKHQQLNTSN